MQHVCRFPRQLADFRYQDELEQELERLKDKLARQKKSSKNSTESMEPRHRFSTTSGSTASDTSHQEVCEICERPGHDIFNCDLLKEDITTIPKHQPVDTKTSQDLFCEDCESHGHLAADCPHSLEVF
jgi:CAP-Gly domain-containing linker protein 1